VRAEIGGVWVDETIAEGGVGMMKRGGGEKRKEVERGGVE
jgi:hypothetical protein